MKEMWEAPRILVEEFAPNEYVSVCYSLKCQVGLKGFTPTIDGQEYQLYWTTGGNVPDSDKYNEINVWNPGNRTEKIFSGTTQGDHNTTGTAGTCNDPASNFVTIDAAGNYDFYEENNEQGTLQGQITHILDVNQDGIWGVGDIFAWVTYNTKNYWRHWAEAVASDASHPNRS